MAKQGHPKKLTRGLLAWYAGQARDLPWRAKPGQAADPYGVWLSEIMLQQTTVAAVRGYYAKFLGLWPDIHALAGAPIDDVLRAWAGLGYYARARNLHACARRVVAEFGGRFPETEAGLRALPGIGPYTAAAISAITFGKPHAAVDGNAERVISRLHAIETPLPEAKPEIRTRAQALVPHAHPGDFAQALMDLGATICTPRRPSCHLCPWTDDCAGRKKGLAECLPRKPAKRPIPTRKGVAFWIERGDGAVLLRRRPDQGLLGGMMEIPSTPWTSHSPRQPESAAPLAASWQRLSGKVEHTFTHFHLELSVLKSELVGTGELRGDGDYRWVRRHDLAAEALPTVMRKVVALALE